MIEYYCAAAILISAVGSYIVGYNTGHEKGVTTGRKLGFDMAVNKGKTRKLYDASDNRKSYTSSSPTKNEE